MRGYVRAAVDNRVRAVKCLLLAVPFAALGFGFSMLVVPSEGDGLAPVAAFCAGCTILCAVLLACSAIAHVVARSTGRHAS